MKSKLPEGWNKVKLKEISKDNSGMYGINASGVDYDSNLYRYLRITDIKDDGTIDQSKKVSVEIKKGDDSKYLLNKNDVVLARTGASAGRSYFYDGTESPMIFAGFLIKFALDDSKVNPEYIKYYFQSREYKEWVKSVSTGSTRPNINAKMYSNMDIILPSFEQQQLLVDTLSALDNKIENNNKINENLEQQAQEIFKHWFVDFEFPNEDGQPYKSSGGEMVESELGMIPKGWEVKKIKEVSEDIVLGKTPKTSDKANFGGATPFLTIPDMHGKVYVDNTARTLSRQGVNTQANKTVPKNSVCVSCIATPGLVTITREPTQTNQQINTIIPKTKYTYIYSYMKSISNKIISLGSGGTATNNLNKTQFSNIDIIIPTKKCVDKYHYIIEEYFNLIDKNQQQSKKLSELRDTLLPKLMSGELRIPLDE